MTVEEMILSELRDLKADLGREIGEVKDLARATNGRVRTLESWRSKVEGAMFAVKALPTIFGSFAAIASVIAVVIAVTQA
ncbi:MAG: hypothetical protein ACRDK4_05040 [Solirubrobacteraceae bacterium]